MRIHLRDFERIAAGLIAVAALVAVALHYPDFVLGKDPWSMVWSTVDFVSKFTILSCLLAATVTGAIALNRRGRLTHPRVAGATVIYLLVTGVTYAALLSNVYQPEGITLIAIVLQHYGVPPAYLLFWLVFDPKGKLRWRDAITWLAFPILYTGYSLLRGALVGWYPYPFLDATALGYGPVLQTVALMIVGFSLVSFGLIAIDHASHWFGRRRSADLDSTPVNPSSAY